MVRCKKKGNVKNEEIKKMKKWKGKKELMKKKIKDGRN